MEYEMFSQVVLALPLLYISVTSEDHNKEEPFSQLKSDIQKRKEEEGSNHFRGKGQLENGGTELHVLASGLHADGPPAPIQEIIICSLALHRGIVLHAPL